MNDLSADQILRMRGLLLNITHCFKDIMEDGIPKPLSRRASRDALSADLEWHECRWSLIRDAEEFLRETEKSAHTFLNIT
jgi:hypothetical protein